MTLGSFARAAPGKKYIKTEDAKICLEHDISIWKKNSQNRTPWNYIQWNIAGKHVVVAKFTSIQKQVFIIRSYMQHVSEIRKTIEPALTRDKHKLSWSWTSTFHHSVCHVTCQAECDADHPCPNFCPNHYHEQCVNKVCTCPDRK